MTTSFTPFVCEHADPEIDESLGTGICIGVYLTAEGPMNLVLWENERTPSPSFHSPNEISWVSIYSDDDLDFSDDDDDDDYDGDDDDDGEEIIDQAASTINTNEDNFVAEGEVIDAEIIEPQLVGEDSVNHAR
jgi:hypothetical protein